MTARDELSRALYDYCLNELCSIPPAWRPRSRWVMNQEWYEELRAMMPSAELRRIAASAGSAVPPLWDNPTHLFGIPFTVDERVSVPRLVTD